LVPDSDDARWGLSQRLAAVGATSSSTRSSWNPTGSPTHLSISCLLSGVHGCGYRCLNDGLLRLLSFRGARSARRIAFRAGITVWIAAPPVAQSLRSAAGITHKSARPSAALLARLPAIPWLRSLLRRLEPPGERQTTLL